MIEGLDHVALIVRDLEPALADYEALLGRTAERLGEAGGAARAFIHLANTSIELIAPAGDGAAGDRVRARLDAAGEGLWLLAFAVTDLAAARRTLERRGIACADAGGARPALLADPATTGGIGFAFREGGARDASPIAVDAAAAVASLDHVVIHTPNPDRALAVYGARLGLDLRLDRANPQWNNRLMFFRCGGVVLEIGAALDAGAGTAPDRFGGLAWRAEAPAALNARLAAAAFNVSQVRPGRKPGTHIFTVRDRTADVPTVVLSAEAAESARSRD
jgi:catechol 2,3-dioxygenase-like lactoylglutathione lyase family enzyme